MLPSIVAPVLRLFVPRKAGKGRGYWRKPVKAIWPLVLAPMINVGLSVEPTGIASVRPLKAIPEAVPLTRQAEVTTSVPVKLGGALHTVVKAPEVATVAVQT